MQHDRIHAREPQQDPDRWTTGSIESLREENGHCIVTVQTPDGSTELVVTFAVRDLFVSRLDIEEGASPVGEQIWYRKRGG